MPKRKYEYSYTVITFKGLVMHNTCRGAKKIIASKESSARRLLKWHYGSGCNITILKPIGDSNFMFKGY